MNRLAHVLLAVALAIAAVMAPASAWFNNPQLDGFHARTAAAAAGGPGVITYATQHSVATACTTCAHTATSIGTASADRVVVVGFHGGAALSSSATNVDIGGTTATIDIQTSPTDSFPTGMAHALVTAGTSVTITVTYSSSMSNNSIAVWAVTGTTTTPNDKKAVQTASFTMDVPANGVAAVDCFPGTSPTTPTGYTERYDTAVSSVFAEGGDFTTVSATAGRTFSNSDAASYCSGISFGP